MPSWEALKTLAGWLMVPIIGMYTWFYQRRHIRHEAYEQKTNNIELSIAEIRTELRYISQDITEIKDQVMKVITKR